MRCFYATGIVIFTYLLESSFEDRELGVSRNGTSGSPNLKTLVKVESAGADRAVGPITEV